MQKSTVGWALCAALVALLPGKASATTLYSVTIQPIQVCNTAGTVCANSGLETYEAAGDKIWAQAGIDLVFLPFTTILDDDLFDFNAAVDIWGPSLSSIIQMFFVPVINGNINIYGIAFGGDNGFAIADRVFTDVRLDTIAHELGHNLGLPHYDEVTGTAGCDAGESLFLMSGGPCRTAANVIGDIYPDGSLLDQLSQDEIAGAIALGLDRGWLTDVSVPEPSTVVFSFTGLAWIALRIRRQRR